MKYYSPCQGTVLTAHLRVGLAKPPSFEFQADSFSISE
ncbi:hypothetical protein RISK_002497 [Rhodopirellula islandica]|uniref:Uncharacterized protein n=1 Tax=Rhodopirellula islandica TaxID=595434 RepID=A0A0J1BH49_RHOIS|nr:hypothetical protein RISK_002497 [Rhodopirellula islandica]